MQILFFTVYSYYMYFFVHGVNLGKKVGVIRMYTKTNLLNVGVYTIMYTWPSGQCIQKLRGSQRVKCQLFIGSIL